MKSFRVIGLMSGTSLDGLDVADVTFSLNDSNQWRFKLNNAVVYPFGDELYARLKKAFHLPAHELAELSSVLGVFYADKVMQFLKEFELKDAQIDFIASHGQTIFHQPDKGFTLQIGNGPELAIHSNIPTVVDFRTKDVALGGNGAPLIPVADHLLFPDYADTFLNLGGFSNFSFKQNGKVMSYDICPVNIMANELVREVGEEYDFGGELGARGVINHELLCKLNALNFYQQKGPKSLGWEWVEKQMLPFFTNEVSLEDRLRTLYEHIAYQVGTSLNQVNASATLVTGGGAKNHFLVEKIKAYSKGEVIVPNMDLIDFKEAIGFAFLGLLRWQNKVNIWSSVTGSKRDSSSGIVIRP
ncbi:anhydro-N-acetylmuramic acid kinase [Brumimicrobium oceani]|uniref:Anhydro-N-acetylmuramic acid kinase n=1 Tax=Brumimicrobium oceani TaxID=2100725 RepID=A0A2U2X0C9_9FLAO|nr:anhydro-N-acetylmuramic acid kinase [Brumimicrobium oceani]PWH81238.1 anhydro-N-acetylmuramic acid kinase [Brumimicrobium oceani]